MHFHLRYLSYVLRHKWYVAVAGIALGVPLWRLVLHDWTTFHASRMRAVCAALLSCCWPRGRPRRVRAGLGAPLDSQPPPLAVLGARSARRARVHA